MYKTLHYVSSLCYSRPAVSFPFTNFIINEDFPQLYGLHAKVKSQQGNCKSLGFNGIKGSNYDVTAIAANVYKELQLLANS